MRKTVKSFLLEVRRVHRYESITISSPLPFVEYTVTPFPWSWSVPTDAQFSFSHGVLKHGSIPSSYSLSQGSPDVFIVCLWWGALLLQVARQMDEESQMMKSIQSSKSILGEAFSTGTSILDTMAKNRDVLKVCQQFNGLHPVCLW